MSAAPVTTDRTAPLAREAEAAKRLGVSRKTLHRWCALGCPHIMAPGRAVRPLRLFDVGEVREWLATYVVRAASAPEPSPRRRGRPRRVGVA